MSLASEKDLSSWKSKQKGSPKCCKLLKGRDYWEVGLVKTRKHVSQMFQVVEMKVWPLTSRPIRASLSTMSSVIQHCLARSSKTSVSTVVPASVPIRTNTRGMIKTSLLITRKASSRLTFLLIKNKQNAVFARCSFILFYFKPVAVTCVFLLPIFRSATFTWPSVDLWT